MEPNSASMPASSRMTSAAMAQSRRAKASSVRRSMEIASSEACDSSTGGFGAGPRSWMLFAMRAIFCASSPMRSRSVTVLVIARIMRRSFAAGWRRPITWLESPSRGASMPLMRWSVAMMSSMWVRSPEDNVSSARRICDSTSPPISSTRERIESRSRSYCLDACSLMPMASSPLAEPAGDVVLGLLLLRLDEELIRHAEFDHLAEVHVGGEVGHPGGLLHVVGDDEDRHALLQILDQLFDGRRGDGIERGGRLVEEQQLRIRGKRARDAQALLLAAGKVEGRLVEALLYFVPQCRILQSLLHLVLDLAARAFASHPQPIGHVFEDRLGKRIRLLEHHAD